MKSRKTLFFSFLFLLSNWFLSAGTSLNILQQSGLEKNVNATMLRSITFSSGNMQLNYQDGNAESVLLSDIQKIYFSSLPMVINPVQTMSLILYPNPVSDIIYLKNIPEGSTKVRIWHISGQKVLERNITSESPALSVGNLDAGLYILKIQNQSLRFSKK